jgi:isoamylase
MLQTADLGPSRPKLPAGMKSVVVDTAKYDWEGNVPLQRPFATAAIYELHVAGFTRYPSSGITAELRGT